MSGQLCQIRPNFQIQFFPYRSMPILCSYLTGFQKSDLFSRINLEMPKIAFQKMTSSLLPVFFYHYKGIAKDIALKFGMCVICM